MSTKRSGLPYMDNSSKGIETGMAAPVVSAKSVYISPIY